LRKQDLPINVDLIESCSKEALNLVAQNFLNRFGLGLRRLRAMQIFMELDLVVRPVSMLATARETSTEMKASFPLQFPAFIKQILSRLQA